jgi:hypothetical protein
MDVNSTGGWSKAHSQPAPRRDPPPKAERREIEDRPPPPPKQANRGRKVDQSA